MAQKFQVSEVRSLPTEALLIPPTSAMLVGGQALALWVNALEVPVPAVLAGGVTVDVDFLGSKADAQEHLKFLEIATARARLRAEVRFPQAFENTPNSAKITIFRDAEIEAEIDYLSHIIGYVGKDEERLKARAIIVEDAYAAGSSLRVMHPFDCLRSRLCNLYSLPNKRNSIHVAQAHLAVCIMKAYLVRLINEASDVRAALFPLLESLIDLATSVVGVNAFQTYGVDVIDCFPTELLPGSFMEKRFPQAVSYIDRRRVGRRGGKKNLLRKTGKPTAN